MTCTDEMVLNSYFGGIEVYTPTTRRENYLSFDVRMITVRKNRIAKQPKEAGGSGYRCSEKIDFENPEIFSVILLLQ